MTNILGPYLGFRSNKPRYWIFFLTENEKVIKFYTAPYDRKYHSIKWEQDLSTAQQNTFYLFDGKTSKAESILALVINDKQQLFRIMKIPGEKRVNRVDRYAFNGREMAWHTDNNHRAMHDNEFARDFGHNITPLHVTISEYPVIKNPAFALRMGNIQKAWQPPKNIYQAPISSVTKAPAHKPLSVSDAIASLCDPQCFIIPQEPARTPTPKPTVFFWHENNRWHMLANLAHVRLSMALGSMKSDAALINFLQSIPKTDCKLDLSPNLKVASLQKTPEIPSGATQNINLMEYICARYLGLSLNQRTTIEAILVASDLWPLKDQFSTPMIAKYLNAIFSQSEAGLVGETKEFYEAYLELVKPENLSRLERYERFYAAKPESIYGEIEAQVTISFVYTFIQLTFMVAACHVNKSHLIRLTHLPIEHRNQKIGEELIEKEVIEEQATLNQRELLLSDIILNPEPRWWVYNIEDLIEAKNALTTYLGREIHSYPNLQRHLSLVWDEDFDDRCENALSDINFMINIFDGINRSINSGNLNPLSELELDGIKYLSAPLMIFLIKLPIPEYRVELDRILTLAMATIKDSFDKFVLHQYFTDLDDEKQNILINHACFGRLLESCINSWDTFHQFISELPEERQLVCLDKAFLTLLNLPFNADTSMSFIQQLPEKVQFRVACLLNDIQGEDFFNIVSNIENHNHFHEVIMFSASWASDFLTKFSKLSETHQVIIIDGSHLVRVFSSTVHDIASLFKNTKDFLHQRILYQLGEKTLTVLVKKTDDVIVLLRSIAPANHPLFLSYMRNKLSTVLQSMACIEKLILQPGETNHLFLMEMIATEKPIIEKVLPHLTDNVALLKRRLCIWKLLIELETDLPGSGQHEPQQSNANQKNDELYPKMIDRLKNTVLGLEDKNWLWSNANNSLLKNQLDNWKLRNVYKQVSDFFCPINCNDHHTGPYSSPGVFFAKSEQKTSTSSTASNFAHATEPRTSGRGAP